MTRVVHSPGRAQQLRYLLRAAVVVGALCLGFAVLAFLAGGSARFATFLAVTAIAVVVTSVLTLRALALPGAAARWGSVASGGLLVVAGLLLASAVVGILPSIVGILLVLLALLPEDGAA